MNLAIKEIKYAKFKYFLIASIIFLLCFLVLFVSSLAQGLKKDNISYIDALDTKYFIVSKDADKNIMNSNLSLNQKVIDKEDYQTLSMIPVAFSSNDKVLLSTFHNPSTKNAALLPKENDEMILDVHLKGEIKTHHTFKGTKHKIHITKYTDYQMYGHAPVGFVTEKTLKHIRPNTNAILAQNLDDAKAIKSKLKDVEIINKDDAKNALPSFQAEQMPLNLMVFFLFLISAIVITVFFYVITIQKTTEYGILKAIGTKTSKLVQKIITEVLTIVGVSISLSIAIMFIIDQFIPDKMPYYLNTNLIFILVGLYILVSLLGALLSVIKVLKIDPIKAIGGE